MRRSYILIICLAALAAVGITLAQSTKAEAPAYVMQGGTPTPTATPEACLVTYTYITSTASLEPAEHLVSVPDCANCTAPHTALPFPFKFYGQTYTALNILASGNLQFLTASTEPSSCPAPYPSLGPAIYPYWANGFDISWGAPCQAVYGRPCGIYTGVTGSAPNRIYTVEWLARMLGSNHEVIAFQARLYETSGVIDFVYGIGVLFGYQASIGIQNGTAQYTSYVCNVQGNYQNLLIRWTPHYPAACPTFTPIATATLGPTDTPAPPIFTPTWTRAPTQTPTVPSTSTSASTSTPISTFTSTSTTIATSTSTPVLTSTGTPPLTPTNAPTSTPTSTQSAPEPSVTPTACTIVFTDVPKGSTFYEFVRCMACRGIINGYTLGCETGDPCFRPGNLVTRGQLAKIVSNAAGFDDVPGAQQFEDVPVGSTFYDFVWRLADREIVSGYVCGGPGEPCGGGDLPYFRPNNNVTRGQMSKIVSNAAGYNDTPDGQQFEDVAPGSTFYDWIWRLVDRGIMSGYPCGGVGEPCGGGNLPYFRPGANATRGQAAKIVSNTFFADCSARLY